MIQLKKLSFLLFIPLCSGLFFVLNAENDIAAPAPISKPKPITDSNTVPTGYFRSPVTIPIYLSGSFGELRTNHFHSGLDIKTFAKEGYPIIAIADGYVARLRVEPYGFGNAIYLAHPNGYQSVYAHLREFNPKIKRLAKEIQYAKRSFEIDEGFSMFNAIKVKKGDTIAFSGNTGSSGGPHLHFELRNANGDIALNPLDYGIKIEDTIHPSFTYLWLYPKQNGKVNGNKSPLRVPLRYLNGAYVPSIPLSVEGKIGFGFEGYDKHNGSGNHNGVNYVSLSINKSLIFQANITNIDFAKTKYINSYIDYSEKIQHRRVVQKNFVDDGNYLNVYKNVQNQGFYHFNDDAEYDLELEIKDALGNASKLQAKIKSSTPQPYTPIALDGTIFDFASSNTFTQEDFKLEVPSHALYDTILFEYLTLDKPAYGLSKIYCIHNNTIPLHKPINFGIKVDPNDALIREKGIIKSTTGGSAGGNYINGWLYGTSKTFGNFYITVDTIPPAIRPITISEGKNMQLNSGIMVKISDNLSGIKSFEGYIDGKWVLMEWDGKTGRLTHHFDELTGQGKHNFKLIVTDYKNNQNTYKATFYL
jgi:murein DD-endopeptidase MepM/ murein hydrolase activator NlpD